MPRPAPHRIIREATPAEKEKYRKMREELEQEKPEIIEQARQWKAAHEEAIGQLHEAFRLLRDERQRQGLSLADLEQRTGMSRSALCRLETDLEANPTITTLQRYADALGKRLLIVVADAQAGEPAQAGPKRRRQA
jgi:ribosome-binding protein aMBF1 (putative translation factor)